jgi:RimJ/RimL family protein N-acetyltransferase
MPHPYWPLFDLRVRTPRLEIRLPTDDELVDLVRVAVGGIHDPEYMPFRIPWTDAPSPDLERGALQWWWRQRAEWSQDNWTLTGAVFVDGAPVGVQDLAGENFGALRTVRTGSWLGRRHQGRGIGKEMRAAVLHLAFAGLGAVEALSEAWADNQASLAVSSALGYQLNGEQTHLRRGQPCRQIDLRLDRTAWAQHRRRDIVIEGLEGCIEMFAAGIASGTRD